MIENESKSVVVQLIATIIQYGIPGLVGAFPLAIVTRVFYSAQAAQHMWLLGAFLIGSWFPLRSVFGVYILKNSMINYIPAHLNVRFLVVAGITQIFMIPILWMMTFASLLLTIAVYVLSGQNFLLTLIFMIVIQCVNLYRQAKVDGDDNVGSMDFQFNVQDMPFDFEVLGTDSDEDEGDIIVIEPKSKRNKKS